MRIEIAFDKAKAMSERAHVDVSMAVHPDKLIGDYAYYSVSLSDGRVANTKNSFEECFEALDKMDLTKEKEKALARLMAQIRYDAITQRAGLGRGGRIRRKERKRGAVERCENVLYRRIKSESISESRPKTRRNRPVL